MLLLVEEPDSHTGYACPACDQKQANLMQQAQHIFSTHSITEDSVSNCPCPVSRCGQSSSSLLCHLRHVMQAHINIPAGSTVEEQRRSLFRVKIKASPELNQELIKAAEALEQSKAGNIKAAEEVKRPAFELKKSSEVVKDKEEPAALTKLWACPTCPNSYTTKKSLVRHERRAHNHQSEGALVSSKSYKDLRNLRGHGREIHNVFVKRSSAPLNIRPGSQCLDVAPKPLKQPPAEPEAKEGQRLVCRICKHTYKMTKTLREHERKVHHVDPLCADRLCCDYCKRPFEDSAEVAKHVREQHQSLFRCLICTANLSSGKSLKRHMSNLHNSKNRKKE